MARIRVASVFLAAIASLAAAGAPAQWLPRGIGGGGAFFNVAMHPTLPGLLMATTDMGVVFRSETGGDTWAALPFAQAFGGRAAAVSFSAGATAFVVNTNQYEVYGQVPSVSRDFGVSWGPLPAAPGARGDTQTIECDASGERLLLSDSTSLFASLDGGDSWTSVANASSASPGLRVAGRALFTRGGWAVAATNEGLVAVSPSLAATFSPWPNASEALLGFAAAEAADGSVRAYALAAAAGSVSAGMMVESAMGAVSALYSATLAAPGAQPSWAEVAGLPALAGRGGALGATFVRMADEGAVYISGMCIGPCSASMADGFPFVMKAGTAAGAPWAHVFDGGNNTHTGWEGSWADNATEPDRWDRDNISGMGWTCGGGGLGFSVASGVAPGDPHRLAFTDWMFMHASFDGAQTWDALYVRAHQRNALAAPLPATLQWESNGLMDTSSHGVSWSSPTSLFAWYTDIRGTISSDGGATMSFNYTGQPQNTLYRTTRDARTGVIYGATSEIHDMYQSTHLTDRAIDADGDNGRVVTSLNGGYTWDVAVNFRMPVVWVALDLVRPGRLYASVANSSAGGVFAIDTRTNVSARLSPPPPRTQGHPYSIVPLPDGALAVSYSGRMDDPRTHFFNSSGVFYLPADAACLADPSAPCVWEDRSAPQMVYWAKDLVADPLDADGDTWFACVFTEWGATRADGEPTRGGLFRTTDRGLTWSSRLDGVSHDADAAGEARIESVTVVASPAGDGAEVYITTEGAGLLHSAYDPSLPDGGLSFSSVEAYPFNHPTRVFQNPYNASEIWVSSFGGGLFVGVAAPAPAIYDIVAFGAVADNKTVNTAAIQRAIDAAAAAGGGLVLVPPGGAFVTATLELRSNVFLQLPLGATLRGSALLADYVAVSGSDWGRWDVLHTHNASNTGVLGDGGVLQGPMWQMIESYDSANNQLQPVRWTGPPHDCVGECRPRLVFFEDCADVVIRGVELRDSADWTQLYRRVTNVSLVDLVVWGSQQWPNNDGVDFESCRGVLMRNVSSFTGDDGVVLASGNCNDMRVPWPEPWGHYTPTRDVVIENSTFSSYSSAIKYEAIFQAWHGDVFNVTVRDVVIHDSARGVGFQQRTGGGAFHDAVFERVTVRATHGIQGGNWWGAGEALWITTLPEAGPNTLSNSTLGGIYNVTFKDCVFEGEQGVVVLSRDQGNATLVGPGALADIKLDNCSVIVGVFGNATRPGVHDLRPIDSGSPEKTAEPQADVPGLSFESAAGVSVRGGSVSFAGPHQPFWAPGATCWTATPDSSVEVDAAFVCSPGEK